MLKSLSSTLAFLIVSGCVNSQSTNASVRFETEAELKSLAGELFLDISLKNVSNDFYCTPILSRYRTQQPPTLVVEDLDGNPVDFIGDIPTMAPSNMRFEVLYPGQDLHMTTHLNDNYALPHEFEVSAEIYVVDCDTLFDNIYILTNPSEYFEIVESFYSKIEIRRTFEK